MFWKLLLSSRPSLMEKTMQRITLTVVALVLAFPVNTRAQEFFGAEREVWDFIERCADTDDFGEFRACFHDDFSGWNYNESMPRGVGNLETIGRYMFDQADVRAIELRPIEVRAYGNFAFAHYVVIIVDGHPDGSLRTYEERWTDILIRENDRWYWIGDHGGPVPNNQ